MADIVYIEDNQAHPGTIVQDSSLQAPTGFTEATTIAEIVQQFRKNNISIDYLKYRTLVLDRLTAIGWANITADEKEYVIDLFMEDPAFDSATNDTNKVTFLMGTGMTLPQAQGHLIAAYASHHSKEVRSCYKRATSQDITELVATYLELSDAADFVDTIKTMVQMYKEQGIKGTQYGTVGEGLMDFIESTVGTSFETIGLAQQGYILKTGTIQNLIDGLVGILIDGNYSN